MAEVRLATTSTAGLRRLGVHDQRVIALHRQLTTILGNRLGRQHAQLLARPDVGPGGDSIDWYAARSGAARPLDQLPEAERQPVETLLRQLRAEIGQLAAKMKREGGSAELAGHMLELAAITPTGTPVWVVDGQPVLVLWGHADEAQAVPDAPAMMLPPASAVPAVATVAPAATPASDASPDEAGADVEAGEGLVADDADSAAAPAVASEPPPSETAGATALGAIPVRRRGGWLPWLLPLLLALLLAWLVWKAMQPLQPVIVEKPSSPLPAADDPLAVEQEREKMLRDQIAELTKQRDERLALCKPEPQPPTPVIPPPPEVTQVEPPKTEAPKADEKAEAKPPAKKETPKKEPPKQEHKSPAVAPPVVPPPVPPKPASPSSSNCPTEYPPGKKPMVVFVVDGSGSMRDSIPGGSTRMEAAKDAVEKVVGGLAPPVELGLIDFSDCDTVNNQGRYYYDDRQRMLGQVRAMTPRRGTPLAYSIKRAGDMMTTRGGREATIVVVTDGDDTCPGRGDPCTVARQVKQEKPNVTINVIDVSGGADSATAQCIASAGGGKVLTPNSAMDMKVKMQQATRLPDIRACKP